MSTPTLATKLYIPPLRSKLVLRPRLVERLNEGLTAGNKLTLISASAGFGKTTLVSEWIQTARQGDKETRSREKASSSPLAVAWLSLDEGDNDPVRFLTYLVAALQSLIPQIGAGLLGVLQSPQLPPIEPLLTSLINEIAAAPGNFMLVLDDYHVIDSQPVDKALAFLLDHLPPQMHLLIATREDPQLPLARLRAQNQLTELRAADLRFTPSEAAEFLNRVMGLKLSPDEIAALETRTEGWIAGLQLAALSMQGLDDTTDFIQSFTGSNRFVLDYLLEEVLQQQPPKIQTFLLRTSILERMCGSLCDAVLLDPTVGGQEMLEMLEHANLFIVPLDHERRWYRYHHLFGDLLRQRLGNAAIRPELHLRASSWHEEHGDLAESFQHALAASDFERAARLAEVAWPSMERTFQTAAWLNWVKKLPDALVCSQPSLSIHLGSALSEAGELELSESHLQNAERALAGVTDQDESKSLRGFIALIRAGNAQNRGNLVETVKYADQALQLIPEGDLYHRAQAVITLEFTHWATGDLEASLQAMHAWMDDMQRLGNHEFAIASAFAVADMQVILGQLGTSEKVLRQAIQQATAQGEEMAPITAHHHLGLALLAHERGDDVTATEHLQIAADLGQRTTLVDWPHRWNMAQAQLKESAREWDAALALFDKARRGYIKNALPIQQPVEAHEARVYLKQGRLDKAQAWVREQGITTEDEVHYLDEYNLLTLVRVRLAEAAFAGVNDLLERLLALAERQKRKGSVIEIRLTQALVHQAQGNQSQAFAALEHALTLAEPEGYLRTFVDEGEAIRLLIADPSRTSCGLRIADRPLYAYIDRLLSAFSPTQPAPIRNPQSTIHNLIEPLSPRELEVLQLVALGLSNHEICKRLFLALDTVKGHNRRIFEKLQVQRRTEAIARAREFGLL